MKVDGLQDKLAVVTGGAQGIGFSIAQTLADQGARVALLDIQAQAVEDAAGKIQGAHGFVADITSRSSVESAFATVRRKMGSIEVLVNNAGIIAWKTFAEGSEADWDRSMLVNAKGVYLCCRAVYDDMKSRRKGCIVNVTSSAAKKASMACPHYGASKAAALNLTLSLAADLAPHGVRVNGIAPSLIATDMFAGKDVVQLSPLGRLGRPTEVADAVAFLCSDSASFITGEILDVNGGFLMD